MFSDKSSNIRYGWHRTFSIASLQLCLVLAVCFPSLTLAEAVGRSQGSVEFEILTPSTPLQLNLVGTFPRNFLFPDSENSGSGSFAGLGNATCTPSACLNSNVGTALKIQLSNDLSCSSSPNGKFGGLEDSFAGFGSRLTRAGTFAIDVRFTT